MSAREENPKSQTKPKSKRSLLRFSLRTMLIGMTLLCILLGWLAYHLDKAAQRKRAVEKIRKWANTTIVYDYQVHRNDAPDRWVFYSDPPLPASKRLVDFVGIDFFAEVVFVMSRDNQPIDISPLADLKNLLLLDLTETEVSDLTPLAELKSLQALQLAGTKVNDLTPLYDLKELKVLNLTATNVSDEEVEKLQQKLLNCRIVR